MLQADIALHVVVDQKSYELVHSVSEFNEFEPRLKSAKNQFQLSAGLNLEKFDTTLNQPYLSRGSNSLNSSSETVKKFTIQKYQPQFFIFIY